MSEHEPYGRASLLDEFRRPLPEESGITYYGEHCGMLHVPDYRRCWEAKLEWYRANEIVPNDEGGGKNGTLIVTRDTEAGGISSPEIERIIREVIWTHRIALTESNV